tara:strand:- start:5 stop:439 length:435 start_codon:yes stop_codon:yes gene_type:complete
MLNYIVYYSFSQSEISSSELEGILRKARKWNEAHEITGLLIYRFNKVFRRGNFLQIIEGPKKSILSAWKRISNDPRHHTITVLEDGQLQDRNFSAWSMGLKNLNTEALNEVPGFININNDAFWSNPNNLKPTALELLKKFYDMG